MNEREFRRKGGLFVPHSNGVVVPEREPITGLEERGLSDAMRRRWLLPHGSVRKRWTTETWKQACIREALDPMNQIYTRAHWVANVCAGHMMFAAICAGGGVIE